MLKLRQVLQEADADMISPFAGWQTSGSDDACTWEGVECNNEGHVTTMYVFGSMHA